MLLCFSYDTKLTTALQESVHRSVDSSLQFTPKESQFPILKEREIMIKHLKELVSLPQFFSL